MYRIGIDLGGTNIAVGLVKGEGQNAEIVKKLSVPTKANRPAEEIAVDMAECCKRLVKEAGLTIDDIEMTGIAAPGTVNSDEGTVEYANNLPFVKFPIVKIIKEHFPCKSIKIDNDANAAALGEALCGAAYGANTSVMITLGTGVGSGIVIDGKIYSGFNHAAGELGHMVIEANGRKCSCGRVGCWEAYSSGTALIKMTKEKIEECKESGRKTVLTDIAEERGKITARTAYDGMRAGDEAAIEVVDEYVKYLACGLTNVVNIFQPEVIAIGGGVANEKDTLLKPLVPMIKKESYGSGLFESTDIRIAKLGNDAGIIGAAML